MKREVPKSGESPVFPDAPASLQFQRDLIALIPQLRAFSSMLCGRRAIAEDMAQEALAKAWRARDRFEPGTNLKAWLFTILRNEYYSHGRRAWRESLWDQNAGEAIPAPPLAQEWAMELSDTARALGGLNKGQREALILVAACGFSHGDAAKVCAAPLGTIKSRVSRARAALIDSLDGGRTMPPRSLARTEDATGQILAQLTVLAPGGAAGAPHAPNEKGSFASDSRQLK
jgi:RNA polymerase sigma-70 factor (ECF subfamily)